MSVSSDYFFYADVNYVDTSNVLSNYMNLTHNINNSLDLSENILSKYARGIFFSPNYNKQFFDAINWANNLGDYKTQLNLINPFNNNVLENLQFDSTIIFTGGIFENGFDKNYTSNVDDIFNPFDLNEPGTISPPVYNYNGNFNNANIFSVSNSSLNEWNGWQPDKDWAISFIVKAPTTNTSCHLMHFGDSNNNNKYASVVWDFYNTNNPDTMRWGVSWTSDSNTGRVDANHLGVVVYPYNLPSNTAYFQLLITYDKRDYTPNGDPNKTGPRIRYKENGRDSDYGLAIFWRGSNDITMFNSEHSDLPWDLNGFLPDNIQSGHTWYATIKENETFNWTQTMTATIGGGPTGIVTHPDHGRHSNRGNIDESGYITDVKFWNTNIDPINQSQYIYSPPSNAIITANDNPTSGPNAGTQVPISLNTDNIEFRNAIAGNTIIPINNVLNIEPSFDKYFSVIPTGLAYPHDWAFYSFYLIQDGVTIVEFNPTQQNSVTFDDSVNLHNGNWGWQYAPSIYHNRTTPVFYVELPSNYVFSNSTITATLVNYNHTHTPASGNFVSASSPNGPWHIRGNWSVSLPLPHATPNYIGGTGVPVSSILDNGWQQQGSDIISWKTPGTYYMRYKATDYDGVETPNNDEHYLTVTVNQGPVIYQSWKISDVTSNSITIPVHGPWMPQKDVYVKVTPVNAGNKFRLRFQGSTSGRYQLKDIRIGKMYIHGTQPHTLSPWYTISINGISGQTFFEFPQGDHQWTDWIDAPIEANTPYLVYFKYHHSRDWYTYWTTSTTNSWVNGTGENRVYNIDLMEVEN